MECKLDLEILEKEKLSLALFLIREACSLIDDVAYHPDVELKITDKLEELSNTIHDKTFEFQNEYYKPTPLQNHLQADIVAKLATDLPKMTEIDEVHMTMQLISKVCANRLTPNDEEHIEQMLSWSEQCERDQYFRKTYLTKEYKNKFRSIENHL